VLTLVNGSIPMQNFQQIVQHILDTYREKQLS